MKTTRNANFGKFVAGYALLYMLPILHLYHYNSEYSRIIPVFNIFEYVSLLGSAIVLFALFCGILFHKRSIPTTSFAVIMLFVSMSGIVGYHIMVASSSQYDSVYRQFNESNAIALINYFVCFAIGYYIKGLVESRDFKRIVVLFYALMVANALFHVDLGQMQIPFRYDQPYTHNYQFFSDTFALFSLILIAMQRWNKILIFTICLSIGIIFLFGGRGGFYALSITIISVFLLNRRRAVLFLATASVIFLAVSIILFSSCCKTIQESRVVTLISAPLSDKSLLERIEILNQDLDRFEENWLFGHYGGHLAYFDYGGHLHTRPTGDHGADHVHSYLSLWSNYGLLVFLPFLWLSISAFTEYLARMKDDSVVSRVYCLLFIFNMIMVIFVRSHYYPYIFINLGILFAFLHEHKTIGSRACRSCTRNPRHNPS